MGKRSEFERNPRDFYPTPYEAVLPLLPYISITSTFVEPCAGDGRLIRHLQRHGLECVYACDLEPQVKGIEKRDMLFFDGNLPETDLIITNPPWKRESMHRMIDIFRVRACTWLLIDAGWMFTEQAKPFLRVCDLIVSVGRVSWLGNGVSSLDDCCWYRFRDYYCETIFKP
jgi:hypothetical protein